MEMRATSQSLLVVYASPAPGWNRSRRLCPDEPCSERERDGFLFLGREREVYETKFVFCLACKRRGWQPLVWVTMGKQKKRLGPFLSSLFSFRG